jgi:hypothetical protein
MGKGRGCLRKGLSCWCRWRTPCQMLPLAGEVELAAALRSLGGSAIRIDHGWLNFIDVCGLGPLVEDSTPLSHSAK